MKARCTCEGTLTFFSPSNPHLHFTFKVAEPAVGIRQDDFIRFVGLRAALGKGSNPEQL